MRSQPTDKRSRPSALHDGPAPVNGQRSTKGVETPEPTSALSPSVNATVYEALKRLYQEGFVTLLPRRGLYAVS
jgi:hypothetical protein